MTPDEPRRLAKTGRSEGDDCRPVAPVYPLRIDSDAVCVLFVCTGNVCRSVMAEALMQSRADAAGWALAATSAGLSGDGASPPRRTIGVMRRRGIDVAKHRSVRLTQEIIDEADLILGSSPEHVWAAAMLNPDAADRAFTLKEFVRLGQQTGAVENAPLEPWIRKLDGARHAHDLDAEHDTIEDPKGKLGRVHERVALEIERLVLALSNLIAPAMTAPSS
jgi:protein-tyrosine phosphatase